MTKWLAFFGIVLVVYFVAVGFMRTAGKAGWSEAGEAKPISFPIKSR